MRIKLNKLMTLLLVPFVSLVLTACPGNDESGSNIDSEEVGQAAEEAAERAGEAGEALRQGLEDAGEALGGGEGEGGN